MTDNATTSAGLEFEVEAKMATTHGDFMIRAYRFNGEPAIVLYKGDLSSGDPLLRIQSSCLFGESFGSVDCDCRWQVIQSLDSICERGKGALVYLFQEGRGIGIVEKVRVYQTSQKYHCDSAEAFKILQYDKNDLRHYDAAVEILKHLGVRRGTLLTNNLGKARAFSKSGISLKRRPMYAEPDDFKSLIRMVGENNRDKIFDYLKFKRDVLGHDFSETNLTASKFKPKRKAAKPAKKSRN